MARLATVLALLALLLPAAPALAQGGGDNPFAPPQVPAPTPEPTPEPQDDSTGVSATETTTLFVIAGGLLVAFVAIGWWIARDARRRAPQHARGRHAMAEPGRGLPQERRRDPKAKARARKKARAQRRARKHNRP